MQTNRFIFKVSNPKFLFFGVFMFSVYCLFSAFLSISISSKCLKDPNSQSLLWWSFRPFENDIILEYKEEKKPRKKIEAKNGSCAEVKSVHLENVTMLEPIVESRPEESYNLLSCDVVEKFWKTEEFKKFQIVSSRSYKAKEKVTIKQGFTKFFGSSKKEILTKEANRGIVGYTRLYAEFKKRQLADWNFKGVPDMIGACFNDKSARLILTKIQGESFCDNSNDNNFENSHCHQLVKLKKTIEKSPDKGKSALLIAQSFVCFIEKLEERRLFVEDFHGSNFLLSPDMSIALTDFDNLIYYGDLNLYGGLHCWKVRHCYGPSSSIWKSNSANFFIYQGCHDIVPNCNYGSCVGFNASLHLCGLSNWVLKPLLVYLTRPHDKIRLQSLITWLSVPYAEVRKSGKEACQEITNIVNTYTQDTKNIISNKKKSFHLGRKH